MSYMITEGIKTPPLFHVKNPVKTLDELYSLYPNGAEYGDYALVVSEGTIYYYDEGWHHLKVVLNKTHYVKVSTYGNAWTSPFPTGATTPGIPVVLDSEHCIKDLVREGDMVVMHVPSTLTSQSNYPLYMQTNPEDGYMVKLIHGQKDGQYIDWIGTTPLTGGFYLLAYIKEVGLVLMSNNNTTT